MAAPKTSTATIAINTALSAAIPLWGGGHPFMIQMPAAWDAASLTFQASTDGTAYAELCTVISGTVTALTLASPAAGQWIALDPTPFKGVNYIKIRSGTSGTPVNQTAARTVTLLTN